jgi:mRNA-degrading endonuclease HigB of HigAB toxin-antitoxin module
MKKKKKKSLYHKIKEIYEKYPEKEQPIKNWDKGGFVNDEKYKQPIKHKSK